MHAEMSKTATPVTSPGAHACPAPTVPYRLPWVGSAIEFGRDPDAFIDRCVQRHGSAFTVLLPGGPRTFLTDPFDFPTLFHTKELVFRDIADLFAGRVFGFDPTRLDDHLVTALVDSAHTRLKGDALVPLTDRMNRLFLDRLSAAVGEGWQRGSLFRFLDEHVFAAGVDALFGDGFYSPEVHRSYATVDRYFPLLAIGVPAAALPGAKAAQDLLADAVSFARPGCSALMSERIALVEGMGLPRREGGRLNATIVWASQANTIATAFWTALLVLRDPHARAQIQAELREVGGDGGGVLDCETIRRMVKLDSAVTETTRLMSMPLTVRMAAEDFTFELASGARMLVRKGETLYPYPRRTHLDPEIYPDPHVFELDRFLSDGGPRHFYKQGKRVAFCLLPFGGGQSMCPGRWFARNEFKIVVATLLSAFDVELLSAEVPGLTLSRVGLGVPPPVKDVPFRIRRRRGAARAAP